MINIYEVTETNNMVEKRKSGRTHHYDGNQPFGLHRFGFKRMSG